MIGVLDLFLAQPFGQKSLLQRILSTTLNDDIKKLQKNIDDLREKIAEDALCDKLRNYVYADPAVQEIIRKDAGMSFPKRSNHSRRKIGIDH
jgi:hypothetical protein